MNKKGFTLIELLATIIILAVIMLIASISVTSIIESSKKGAYKNNIKQLLINIQGYIIQEKLSLPLTYTFTEEGMSPEIDNISGKLPTSGVIQINWNAEFIVNMLSDDEFCVSTTDIDNFEVKEVGSCENLIEVEEIIEP